MEIILEEVLIIVVGLVVVDVVDTPLLLLSLQVIIFPLVKSALNQAIMLPHVVGTLLIRIFKLQVQRLSRLMLQLPTIVLTLLGILTLVLLTTLLQICSMRAVLNQIKYKLVMVKVCKLSTLALLFYARLLVPSFYLTFFVFLILAKISCSLINLPKTTLSILSFILLLLCQGSILGSYTPHRQE